MNLRQSLLNIGVIDWRVDQLIEEGHQTFEHLWETSNQGQHLLYIAALLTAGPPWSPGRRPLVLATCEIARLTLPVFEKRRRKDQRPRKAIETAESWARGGLGSASAEAVAKAASAAAGAADAADAAADTAYDVGSRTFDAAEAAYTAAVDATAAVTTAFSVASTAHTAADVALITRTGITNRADLSARSLDIIRKYYPVAVMSRLFNVATLANW